MLRALTIALAMTVPAVAMAQPQIYSNRWDSDQPSTFTHVIVGAPGRKAVTLDATTSASGGETVAVYPMGADGQRGKARLLFVTATTRGNSRAGQVTLPAPARGETVGRLPVVIVVENASERRHAGEYTLTVAP
jgi:hypothetical protein